LKRLWKNIVRYWIRLAGIIQGRIRPDTFLLPYQLEAVACIDYRLQDL
jgi:hypothetical protein